MSGGRRCSAAPPAREPGPEMPSNLQHHYPSQGFVTLRLRVMKLRRCRLETRRSACAPSHRLQRQWQLAPCLGKLPLLHPSRSWQLPSRWHGRSGRRPRCGMCPSERICTEATSSSTLPPPVLVPSVSPSAALPPLPPPSTPVLRVRKPLEELALSVAPRAATRSRVRSAPRWRLAWAQRRCLEASPALPCHELPPCLLTWQQE